jgi:SPW repeat
MGKEGKMDERQTSPSSRTIPQSTAGVSWINILLGIWVIISPFVLGFSMLPAALWNNVATGGAVAILALIRTSVPQQPGWSWINAILGIWLIISPFALGFVSGAALWNSVILGIIITIIAWGNAAARVPATA